MYYGFYLIDMLDELKLMFSLQKSPRAKNMLWESEIQKKDTEALYLLT